MTTARSVGADSIRPSNGAPAATQRSGRRGERRHSGGNELSGLPGSERSAAWADAVGAHLCVRPLACVSTNPWGATTSARHPPTGVAPGSAPARGRACPAGAPLLLSKAVGKPPGPAFFEVASRGFSSKAPPAPSTLDPGPMAAVGCDWLARTGRALPPASSAQVTDRSLRRKRQSSFPPLCLLSPPNPLRWASAGAPLLVSLQALPRLGRHASGLPCRP